MNSREYFLYTVSPALCFLHYESSRSRWCVRIYLEHQGIISSFVSRGLVNGNIRSNEAVLPV